MLPYQAVARVTEQALQNLRQRAKAPVWAPWPLPPAWLVSGLAWAGDERTGPRATVFACSGPSPLGGAADLVLIAEEPGVGLGCRFSGLPGPDPGAGFDAGQPDAKVEAAGHPTALWSLPAAVGCAAFVGEAKALWLWAILWPPGAGVLLYESLVLTDLRETGEADFAFGPALARLTEPG